MIYTLPYDTFTSEGLIPHKEHPEGFWMPVKLIPGRDPSGKWRPLKRDGEYIYALPGGLEYEAD